MDGNTSFEFGRMDAQAPTVVRVKSGEGSVELPGGSAFLRADFSREGFDLILDAGPDGSVIIPNYFLHLKPADLVTEDGAVLPHHIVRTLAGPMTPGQVAQLGGPGAALGLGEPIGSVSEATGSVSVVHPDGVEEMLTNGSSIFQGDVLETGPDGSVSVIFVDDTVFSLDNDGRMVMDEMVYDPGTETGVFNAMVVQGVFSFVSGQVAKTSPDGMVVNTPTSTIGIRGSTVLGNAAAEGSENKITLVRDVDGKVGEIIVTNGVDQLVLNVEGASTTVFSSNAALGPVQILSQQQIQQNYGGSLTRLVKTVAKQAEQKAERAEEEAQQAEAEAEAAKAEADAAAAEAEAAAAEAEAAAAEAEAALAEAEAAGDAEAIAEAEAKAVAAAEAKAAAEAAAAEAEAAAAEAAAAEAQAAAAAAEAQQAAAFSSMASTAVTVQVAAEAAVAQDTQNNTPDDNQDQTADTADTADTTNTVTNTDQQAADDAAAAEAAALAAAEAEAAAKAAAEAAAKAAAEAAAKAAAEAEAAAQAEAENAVNVVPQGVNETLSSVLEDAGAITGQLLAIDSDGPSKIFEAGTVSNGTLVLSSTGSYTFTPDPNFNGTASFTYTVSDGIDTSTPATVTVSVTPVNDAPTVVMSTSGGTGSLAFSNTYAYETLMTNFQASGSALGDVDGDGDLDIIINGGISTTGQPWNTYVGLNDGSGTFTYSQVTTSTYGSTNTYFRTIDVGDVNADGKLDFVTINNETGFKAVYLGDGAGGFTATNQTFDFTGGTTGGSNLKMADLDGDGDLDIFANIDAGNRVYLNDGTGTFTDTNQQLKTTNISYRSVDFGDIDGDGDLDAVTGSWGEDINIWLNDGNANFSNTGTAGTGTLTNANSTNGIALGDLDGDGDLDIFSFDRGTGGNKVFINNGSGSFTNSGQTLGATSGGDTVRQDGQLVDIDNDGDLDAISATDGQMEIFINDGSATFTQNSLGVGGGWSTEVRAGDLNGDGLQDVLVANYATGSHILTNTTPVYADSLVQGGSFVLNGGATPHLLATDVDGDTPLTYTLSSIPTNGTLSVNGVAMALDGVTTFTQTQLDNGEVVYAHNGTSTTSDAFTFSVSDGNGGTTSAQTFNLSVTGLPSGTYTNASGSTLNLSANVTPTAIVNDGTLNIVGGVISSPSTITNNATMNFTAGSLSGNITNNVGGVLNFSTIGTVIGTVTNHGTVNATTGAKRFDGFVNNGVLDIASGVTFEGSYNNYPVMNVGSSIQGNGTFKTAAPGAYTYNGIWNPGTDGTVGSLFMNTWDGNFGRTVNMSSSTVYNVDVASTGSYDTLTLQTAHASAINGTLNLKSISGYTPTSGDSFTVLNYTTGSTGTFTVTHDFGAGWNVVANYGTTSLTLTVLSDAAAITGTAGNDTLLSLTSNDTIDGGAGTDVLNLSGTLTGHTLGFAADGTLTITDTGGTDGTDTVTNVESLKLPDATVTVGVEAAEFLVNTTTTSNERDVRITDLDDGGFLMVWQQYSSPTSVGTTYAQRYDAIGAKVGSQFAIGPAAAGTQHPFMAVEGLHGGSYVVAWPSTYTLGTGTDIIMQVYNSSGTAVGGNITVPSTTTGQDEAVDIVEVGNGLFMVTWVNTGNDGSAEGVFGRVYDSTTATAKGNQFQLNTSTANSQTGYDVAQLEGGNVVVAYQSDHGTASNSAIYFRVLQWNDSTNAMTEVTAETAASTAGGNVEQSAKVAALMNGGFAVAYFDSTAGTIYTKVYDSVGGSPSATVAVGTASNAPSAIAELEGGGYVIVWHNDPGDGSLNNVYARQFNADGSAKAAAFMINTTTTDHQYNADVAPTPDGGFLITWQSNTQDGTDYGVYAQRYDLDGNIVGRTTLTGDSGHNYFTLAAGQKGLSVVGGGGTDTVTLAGATGQQNMIKATNISGVTGSDANDMVLFGSSLNNHSVNLGAGKDTVKLADGGNIQTFQNVEEIIGGSGNDNIASSTAFAAADNAMVSGGAGTDNLNLSSAGNNTVEVEDVETINGGTATDTLTSQYGSDYEGVTFNSIENIIIDSDNNETTGMKVSSTTTFNSAVTVTGSGNNDSIVSADGMDLTNVTLSGISSIHIDSDSSTANTVGATLTLGAQALPAGVTITGSGDDFIQMAGTTLDLSNSTLTGISQIKGSTGNDTITGSGGADYIYGGAGVDSLTGGAGGDVFVYTAASDSATGSEDSITDFVSTSDKFDISSLAGGSFNFGTLTNGSGFTVQAQQVGTVVQFDTNDDGVADMGVDVGATTVAVGDFIA